MWFLIILLSCIAASGCFINKVPSTIFVFAALLLAKFTVLTSIEWGHIALVFAFGIASIYLSKVIADVAGKIQKFSKKASWGITFGSIFGLIFLGNVDADSLVVKILLAVIGLVAIPFASAFLIELLAEKKASDLALKCATSATVAYIADSFLKFVVLSLTLLLLIIMKCALMVGFVGFIMECVLIGSLNSL